MPSGQSHASKNNYNDQTRMIEKAMARIEVRILKAAMPIRYVILAYDWLI